jgi:hypothetical protein
MHAHASTISAPSCYRKAKFRRDNPIFSEDITGGLGGGDGEHSRSKWSTSYNLNWVTDRVLLKLGEDPKTIKDAFLQ